MTQIFSARCTSVWVHLHFSTFVFSVVSIQPLKKGLRTLCSGSRTSSTLSFKSSFFSASTYHCPIPRRHHVWSIGLHTVTHKTAKLHYQFLFLIKMSSERTKRTTDSWECTAGSLSGAAGPCIGRTEGFAIEKCTQHVPSQLLSAVPQAATIGQKVKTECIW